MGNAFADAVIASANKVSSPIPPVHTAAPAKPSHANRTSPQARSVVRDELRTARALVDAICRNPPNEAQAIALVREVAKHLATANEAIAHVDRVDLLQLDNDVETLSQAMKHLGQVLSVAPKLPWHAEFAAAFDTELELRGRVGLEPVARPYTGLIDPAIAARDAMTLVNQAKGAMDVEASEIPVTDPQQAVGQIGYRLMSAFEEQRHALEQFRSDIAEDWPAPAGFAKVIAIAVDIAIAVASSGIANMAEAAVTTGLERVAARSLARPLTEAAEATIAAGSARRAAISDLVKSGVKGVMSPAMSAAVAAAKQGPNSTTALGMFVGELDQRVATSKDAASDHFARVAPALGKLELAALIEIVKEMKGLRDFAGNAITRAAMVQWQNLKAQHARPSGMTRGGLPLDPNLDAPPAGPYGDEPISGVLEVGVRMSTMPELSYLVLRGGEPAAVKHFKRLAAPIASLGLNRQYQLSFEGLASADPDMWRYWGAEPSLFVKLGVGARDGFQPGTLSKAELLTLKIYRAGQQPNAETLVRGAFGAFEHISDAEALAVARSLIRFIDQRTTSAELDNDEH